MGYLSHLLAGTIVWRTAVRLSAGIASEVRDTELVETEECRDCSSIPWPVRRGIFAVQLQSWPCARPRESELRSTRAPSKLRAPSLACPPAPSITFRRRTEVIAPDYRRPIRAFASPA